MPTLECNIQLTFKAFYARIFAHLQQKDTSGHLTKLWHEDPFKAKWTIVAKAYSRIRDLVGKTHAPLDGFLSLACPEIGIIGVEDYLSKMNWSMQVEDNGTISLQQSTLPFPTAFEQRIMHTSMTDSDVITFVATQGYISLANGRRLTQNPPPTQNGLLASAPAFQPPALPRPTLPSSDVFLQTAASDPMMAASIVLGFDVHSLLNSNPYEWTGSMSDLYNPAAGSIDFQSVSSGQTADAWDVSNIQDPEGFESLFGGAVEGGYITPYGRFARFFQMIFTNSYSAR
jgi:hypothetical protein